jgi:hypothetical protein
MLFRRTLPKKADMFVQTKRPKLFPVLSRYYKPVFLFRTLGIVTIGVLLMISAALIFTPSPLTATSVRQAETGPSINDPTTMSTKGRDDSNYNDQSYDNQTYNNQTYYDPRPIDIQPLIRLIDTSPSLSPQSIQTSGLGIGAISSQIIGTQQNIANQMQGCVNNARQMANQIINLKNQQKQIQSHIDSMRQREFDIDTSTDSGQRSRDALDRQIQQLQDQSDALDRAISNAQQAYNTSNDNCQQRVDQLKQNREDAESNLDDAFSKGMDIQIPF